MEKQVKLMNQYVADLAVLNVKFHNLHWNVAGERFEQVHVYVEKLYDILFENYDEVAERLKMIGEYPLASLRSYLEVTSVEEIDSKDYKTPEVYEILKEELTNLRALATEIRNLADDENDFGTVAMLEDQIGGYDKELYFISQALK